MKILHVATTLGPKNGGAAVACIELCLALADLGHTVEIVTTNIDVPPDWRVIRGRSYQHKNISIHFATALGSTYYWFSPALALLLWRKVPDFDVVHIHSLYRFHLPVTSWVCRWFKKPYVVKPHGSLDPFLFRYRRWRKIPHEVLFDRPAYAHAAAIQYVAREEQRLAESTNLIVGLKTVGVVVPSAVVVPEGTSIGAGPVAQMKTAHAQILFDRFPNLCGKRIVLFLGRLNFKKGMDILVKAFASVQCQVPNAHVLFVGPDSEGYSAQIKMWLEESQVSEHATFTGMLLGEEKTAAFCAAEVFVLSSYTENFGIAIIEAMAQGCPVVISNKVNIWQEIQDVDAGIVTDCDDIQTANAILRVLKEPGLAARLVANGKRLATEHFTWPVAGKKMEIVYREILTRGAQPWPEAHNG